MRWLHLTVIILFSLVTLIFILQNREIMTMSFLTFSIRMPFAMLVAVAYITGAATGSSLFALLRRSYQASRRKPINTM